MANPNKRLLGNWLRAYMEYTIDTESPDAYHFWVAATVIGAVTKRQVYMDMNFFKVFPNFYTILVGPSGARKSVSLDIGGEFAEAAGVKKFADRITGAALAEQLEESQIKFINEDDGEVQLVSPMMIYSSELGVFLGAHSYQEGTIADLTDLYDCKSRWVKRTKTRGTNEIIGPYVSMLAATTPQTLRDVIPYGAVGQGFTSRICFVWASGRRKRVPIPTEAPGQVMLREALKEDLRTIAGLRGVFHFNAPAMEEYQRNYLNRPDAEEEFDDERLRGYSSRKDIYLIKTAMIMSLSRNNSMVLELEDVKGAMEVLSWLEQGLPNVFESIGKSAHAEDVVRILAQIKKDTEAKGWILHSEALKRNYHQLNASEFGLVIDTLEQAGAIKVLLQSTPGGRTQKVYQFMRGDIVADKKSKPGSMNEREDT